MPTGNKSKEQSGMRHMTKKPSSSTGKGGYARSTMGTGRRSGASNIKGAMGKNQSTGNGGA